MHRLRCRYAFFEPSQAASDSLALLTFTPRAKYTQYQNISKCSAGRQPWQAAMDAFEDRIAVKYDGLKAQMQMQLDGVSVELSLFQATTRELQLLQSQVHFFRPLHTCAQKESAHFGLGLVRTC